jgi:hypothetical protein
MFEDLDPKLSAALEDLRREFDKKLAKQRAQLESLLGSPEEPIVGPVIVEPIAVESTADGLDPLEELKLAATEIDGAESQADVLDAMIRAGTRFASRTAVFLHRGGALEGWGGAGFGVEDSTITGLSLDASPDSAWARVTEGIGGITLSQSDCALMSEQLGVETAEIGVLVPFVLQDQVAAVLYADRLGSDAVFNVSALQLLSFIGGQTVETLPIRDRTATISLILAAHPDDGGALPDAAVAPPAPAATLELAVEEVELETVEADQTEWAAEESIPEAQIEPAPEPTPETMGFPPGDEPAAVEAEPATEESIPAAQFEPAPESTPETEGFPAGDELESVPTSGTAPAEAGSGETPGYAEAPAAPDSEPEPAAPVEAPKSTQVEPPTDIEGPGWAFTTTKIPSATGAEAQHEEARRLARLLVTEIKLYNEETVEQGRASGNVYARLRDDIERSRQIFEDRIAPEVRSEKDYFQEALIRILAGGDTSALGM